MRIPLKYSIRNLLARRLTTAFTVFGITLVVFVFAGVLMLAQGLKQTLISSGSADNVVVIRAGSGSEMQSFVSRDQAAVIRTLPEIALDSDGEPLVAGELVIILNKDRRTTAKMANITLRGVEPGSFALRPNVRIFEGRSFERGKTEVIAGRRAADNFKGCGLGETFDFGNTKWTVVGVFDAAGSAFENELWGDVDMVMPAAGRPVYSSMLFRMQQPETFAVMRDRVKADPRMKVEIKREKQYYAEQTQATATFIEALGLTVTIIFSLGATIGAMITMYGAVANRTREIATMRALGFLRRNVLAVFLIEAVVISTVGGLIGLAGASFLQLMTISTTNWDTFSEITFNFRLSPEIAIGTMLFAMLMGILGGFLPAVRAARIRIVDALRAE